MAIVDFSNAVLDVYNNNQQKPLEFSNYLGFNAAFGNMLLDSQGNVLSSATRSIITDTPTKISFLYRGTFNDSGTEFYIGYGGNTPDRFGWKVSNISFSANDTFAFVIDIEVSGNS